MLNTDSDQQRYPVVALVGPSGAGKTSLMFDALKIVRGAKVIMSYITRPYRTEGKDALTDPLLNYPPISAEEIKKRNANGEYFQLSNPYPGCYYANTRENVLSVTRTHIGLIALVEDGVRKFREAGFKVIVINIIPIDKPDTAPRDPGRAEADAERSKSDLVFDHVIENSFAEDGFEDASDILISILSVITYEAREKN